MGPGEKKRTPKYTLRFPPPRPTIRVARGARCLFDDGDGRRSLNSSNSPGSGRYWRYDDPMRLDTAAILAQRVDEVASWCSLQELTAFHQDSPDQAHRRELLKEANRLLTTARYKGESWLQRSLPNGRRWTRAMNLIKEADPDSLAPLEHQLRSSKLKPTHSIGGSYSEESIQEIVDGVIDLRSSLIKSRLFREHTPSSQLRGRLLLYIPSENVSDGASRFASNGFFDADDCPPWDLWLRYSDRALINWVPEVLFPLAQAGIDANPVECIRWAD